LSEDDLLKIAVNGDNEAFRLLINPYIKQAHQTAFLLLHDYSLAEDAVQEALFQVHSALKRFDRNIASFKTWFTGILINCTLKINRKRRPIIKLNERQLQDNKNNLEQNYLLKEESQLIINCVTQLKAKYKTIVILYYFQEMSVREISLALGLKEGTVKSRLYKSRELLKEALEDNDVISSLGGGVLWNES
jgi:RNA polymerase sigma factor (sigma-70 family)